MKSSRRLSIWLSAVILIEVAPIQPQKRSCWGNGHALRAWLCGQGRERLLAVRAADHMTKGRGRQLQLWCTKPNCHTPSIRTLPCGF